MNKPYDIDYLLDEVVTLPSLPTAIERITELINTPDCPMSEIAKVISTDPALALKTLRLVNSAYYGLREPVTSVEHATVLLGLKVVKNLVFSASVFDTFKNSTGSFLRHSVSCGVAMRSIVEALGRNMGIDGPDEAFVFGLLHDTGKLLFEQYLPDDFAKVVAAQEERGTAGYQLEQEVIGVDHAEMGARLAEKWRLPAALMQSIAGHHELERCDAEFQHLAALLAVADYMCCATGLGAYGGETATVADEMWIACSITSKDIPVIMDHFFDSIPMIDELLEVAKVTA